MKVKHHFAINKLHHSAYRCTPSPLENALCIKICSLKNREKRIEPPRGRKACGEFFISIFWAIMNMSYAIINLYVSPVRIVSHPTFFVSLCCFSWKQTSKSHNPTFSRTTIQQTQNKKRAVRRSTLFKSSFFLSPYEKCSQTQPANSPRRWRSYSK